ncbi:caprin-1-like isoform X1 [Coregonus clupeaformis]|uniref:caprin-1-like isoform X1 n=1 Tax=Coregonus clupeaformis TaxID=59861 RepID=UPI001E1C555E|nr:caprin-1-like isoform X1 [Coregonus clupeaformis]
MPSATVGNNAFQSSSPELGSGTQSEAMKQVLQVIDKKVRNMEKKKGKLDDYQAKKNKGELLNQDQLDALTKFQEVTNNLDFARELQKSFLSLGQEIQKAVKKSARREQLQREETEQRRLKTVLELQFLLDRLGDEQTRQDLKQPAAGSPLLTDADLTALDNFYKLVGPERDHDVRLTDQYEEASLHLWELLECRDQAVAGTTYKALKETLNKVLLSGYFDRAQTHQNGVCEEEEVVEEEEEEQSVAHESSGSGEQPAEPEETVTEEYTEAVEVEATEFVNRQFIPETTYSRTGNDQVEEWTAEAQVVNALQHQPPPQMAPEPHTVNPVSHTPDPVVRKQVVQDLMAQMQGTYNFMQDSMLEFDGHALDPAIVLAQPMKPAQSVDLQQMGQFHSESRLPQPSSIPESTQVPMVSPTPDAYSSTPPLYQPSHTAEPQPQTDSTDHIQASTSLSSEQSPAQSSLPSAFPPVSTPHSGGINVNAAPFQSMQAVFNLNAPVPPTNEADSLKQNQFPSSYGQGFSSQAEHSVEHSVEQPDIQQDTLQSGGFHTQDQVISSAAGHQVQSSQGPGFGRQGQSFYNSRGAVPRGGPRNPRGMINGYRGSSNGFRGGYDGYRPPFSNTPNNGYGQQAQFSTAPRDYSNSTYQREGYQPGYKRGAAQGPRGCSRAVAGRGGLFKPSRGMVTQMAAHQAN